VLAMSTSSKALEYLRMVWQLQDICVASCNGSSIFYIVYNWNQKLVRLFRQGPQGCVAAVFWQSGHS
jgi:hypothetical protein